LRAPTVKETRIFEQKQKGRELEEELKVALNFLMDTITSTIKPTSQVIVISDSKEKG
jgi:hypothetical protein